ncbi:MAG: DUF6311 domain-containing protein [Verrucomicrobiota bacterium]|nr:DUF6311 domain-containing protein [Verrucomicrobiota bacterium]
MTWFIKRFAFRINRGPEIAAACMGLLIALTYFNLDYVTGTADWLSYVGDRLQHVSGGNYFIQDSWRFPLLDIKNVNTPEGANLAMMDGIPVAGIFCKLVVALFHHGPFNYIGYWLVFCFMMQGWFAVRLMRALGHTDWLVLLIAALFALSYPPFIFRFGHAALTGHFLLLWALTLYVEGARSSYPRVQHLKFALLAMLAVMVHIYLMAMIMVIYLGFTLQQFWKVKNYRWWNAAFYPISILAVILLMIVLGIIRWGESIATMGGYGIYSMNLLSPFWPQWSGIFRYCGIPLLDPTNGQYEGYAYLGLGVILLFIATLIMHRRHWQNWVKSHRYLFLLLVALLFFIVSHRIYFAEWKLVTLPKLGSTICDHFRCSGRFIWPIGYLVIFLSLHLTVVHVRRVVAVCLLIPLGLMQHYDSQGVPSLASRNLRIVSGHESDSWVDISNIIGKHAHVDIFPYFGCGDNLTNEILIRFVYLSSVHNVSINAAYLARNMKLCTAQAADIDATKPGNDNLIVLLKPIFNYMDALRMAENAQLIRETELAFLISNRWDQLPAMATVSSHESISQSEFGDSVRGWNIPINGDSWLRQSFISLREGFSAPETWGVWTNADEAILLIDSQSLPVNGCRLTITWHAFISKVHRKQSVKCTVNNEVLGAWSYEWPNDEGERVAEVIIAEPLLSNGRLLTVHFSLMDAVSPKQLGQNDDSRMLGMGFRKIAIHPLRQ